MNFYLLATFIQSESAQFVCKSFRHRRENKLPNTLALEQISVDVFVIWTVTY